MKKIVVVIMMLLVIPLMTVEKINNKNYYLETETNTYTKEEIDNKINELLTKINDNTTKITETKNILTDIKNKLDDYALKTALTKTNEDITALDELANQNKARIDELENNPSTSGMQLLYSGLISGTPTSSYTYQVPAGISKIFISASASYMINWDTDANTSGGDFSIKKNGDVVTVSNKIYEIVRMKDVSEYGLMRGGYYMDDVTEGDTFVITSIANSCAYGYTVTTVLNLQIIGM